MGSIPAIIRSGFCRVLAKRHAATQDVGGSRSARLLNLYIAGLAALALILLGLLLRPEPELDWVALLIFVAITALSEAISTDVYGNDTSVSTSMAPLLAATLICGPIGAVSASLVVTILNQLKHRGALNRFIFNLSNHLVSSLLVAGLLSLIGRPFINWGIPVQLLVTLGAATLIYLTTTTMVAIAVGLSTGQRARDVWTDRFQWLAPNYLALGFVAYALTASYVAMGPVGVVVVLIPLLTLHFSQRQYVAATEKVVSQLKQTNQKLAEQSEAVNELNSELFIALASTIDLRDPDVVEHSINVARYAVLTAKELGLPPDRIELVRRAGLMHDIGKLAIPEVILFKPDRLTPEEHHLVKDHVTVGADLLAEFRTLEGISTFVRYHHERYDGEGYPDGLPGEAIPLEARILALADAVEAMASDRPYRVGMDVAEIIAEIDENAGSQFDPVVVSAFARVVEREGSNIIVNSARHEVDRSRSSIRLQFGEFAPEPV